MRVAQSLPAALIVALFTAWWPSVTQSATLPADVTRLVATFNDDEIAFNENPLVLGSTSAKLTALFFYAPSSEDTENFMRRVFPALKSDYIDKGKLRLVIIDYPLNWKDMQVLAGLRCVPGDKHLEAILRTTRDNWTRTLFNQSDFNEVPRQFSSLTRRFDVPDERAIKCMRNTRVLGFIEGSRKLALDSWNINESPAIVAGNEVLRTMNVYNPRDIFDFLRKHGME